MAQQQYNPLTPEEARVILHKGTEPPFSGSLLYNKEKGTYLCKRCNAPLYRSDDKFESHCGWPSFDDEISGAVARKPDADGRRTEILCANCGAHLGHVFEGEGFTPKNVRHCVNSISLRFVKAGEPLPPVLGRKIEKTEQARMLRTAVFAGGCFWGVEYHFEKAKGVISAVSGYTGGKVKNPTYQQVCSGTTGHVEAVRVTYDPEQTDYETLAKLFFEIHDPTQLNRQGPDVGEQYRSVIFYQTEEEKEIAEKLVGLLKEKGYRVVTRIEPLREFWEAEEYHQDYYTRKGTLPYCHVYTKRF
ncbi:MAG: bifunctional methionine sulfoxide reductase B/A protein [candidate division KSB1 bacterium]|nr:bifunctional methionine sulfoxide reductase B/A protein [candidate division KSB1 bacterium]